MTTTISLTNTGAGVSPTLRDKRSVDVTLTYTGGTSVAGTFSLERALSPDESAWVTALGPYNAAQASFTATYRTPDQDTRLRLRVLTGSSSAPIVLSAVDSNKTVMTRTDDDGDSLEFGTPVDRTFNSNLIVNGTITTTSSNISPVNSQSNSSAVPIIAGILTLDTSGQNVLLPVPVAGPSVRVTLTGGTSAATTLKITGGTSVNTFLGGGQNSGTLTFHGKGASVEIMGISPTQYALLGRDVSSSAGITLS